MEIKNKKGWFLGANSINMIGIEEVHNILMYYIIIILIFVTYSIFVKIFWDKTKLENWNHSIIIEIIWTILPGIILIMIGIPSFKLLYSIEEGINSLITLKVKGLQWYWNYSIKDITGLEINQDSFMKNEEELKIGEPRLLEVDNKIVLPINKPIRVLVTGEDVIHSFALPDLGVKVDAIPGRINNIHINILEKGLYYGQCSELCGIGHALMPIEILAVDYNEYIKRLITLSNVNLDSLIKVSDKFETLL